jgi:hypothetical protein
VGGKEARKTIESRTQPELVPNQASKSNIVRGALEIFDDAWRAAAINGQLACEHQIILAAARVAMVVNP